jgi:plasmid rolling circle replication initiator protein Rep
MNTKVLKQKPNSKGKTILKSGYLLDTIAQLVPPPKTGALEGLKKRAKNQYFSKKLAQKLTWLGNDSPLYKAYKRTLFDCGSIILQEGNKMKSGYCNARWCNTCNRMRTAKLIHAYKSTLEAFKDPYFLTLTFPNVNGSELTQSTKKMIKNVVLIIKNRRKTIEINGIRKLETTYNEERDDFHPHFHFIIDGKENAEYVKNEWLKKYKTAQRWSQDIRKADKGSIIELFKYTTKLVSKSKKEINIWVYALDTIFQSMYGSRTFQSFGKVRIVKEDIENLITEEYIDLPSYAESVVWKWEKNDWINMTDGKKLTGYEPSEAMKKLTTEKMILKKRKKNILNEDSQNYNLESLITDAESGSVTAL